MHRFEHAIVRAPAPNFADGITTVEWAEPPSYGRLLDQHAAYIFALRHAGLRVELLPPLMAHPDAHFVEDVAVVVPELAILTRPGAEQRRGEVVDIADALADYRRLTTLDAPATLDGGDVLVVERQVFVGLSTRTNEAGCAALAAILEPLGYRVTGVPVAAGLHFKSSVNLLGPKTLVATAEFARRPELAAYDIVRVGAGEAYAANILRVNDHVLIAAGYPALTGALRARELEVLEVDMSEVAKMDGGLTCLSLRL